MSDSPSSEQHATTGQHYLWTSRSSGPGSVSADSVESQIADSLSCSASAHHLSHHGPSPSSGLWRNDSL